MSSSDLIRGSGLALILGGVSFGLFMLLHPFDQLAGPHGAQSAAWVPAHSFHFLGALFSLFGLVGLYARQIEQSGRLGLLGFVLAFVGTAMFVGTGMITAYLWPVIARYAPDFVEADGAMFSEPLARGTIEATYAFLVVGYVVFSVATMRAGVFPRWNAWLLIVGIVLFSVPVAPVGPVPWIVRVVGALVFGAALVALGYALRARAEEPLLQPRVTR